MAVFFNLNEYLGKQFPGLELGGGLFYRWPIGIRFELGIAHIPQRPMTLYEACFQPLDSSVVISQDYNGSNLSSRRRPLYSLEQSFNLRLPFDSQKVEGKDEEEQEYRYYLQWVQQPARSFQYDQILQQVANADHTIDPAISSRVFFLNPVKALILHMYDDRGMDIIATRIETLSGLYSTFGEWILEYDRKRIDQTFGRRFGIDVS